MSTTAALLTAEDFLALADDGPPLELVRGKVVPMNVPNFEHGVLCGEIAFRLRAFLDLNDIGRVTTNDAGFITERDPDTVRGPDVAFFSYQRVPKERGRLKGYPPEPPEIAFEVLSPNDEWKEVLTKIAEYLTAGVLVVCVIDPGNDEARLYYPDRRDETIAGDGEVAFPTILPGFGLKLARLFGD
jgi:Uma2 family endonuclease